MSTQEISEVKSFAQLVSEPAVSGDELVSTLEDYADIGAAIRGDVVLDLVGRTELTTTHLESLHTAAIRGLTEQARNRLHSSPETVIKEQSEYAQVAGAVGLLLEAGSTGVA